MRHPPLAGSRGPRRGRPRRACARREDRRVRLMNQAWEGSHVWSTQATANCLSRSAGSAPSSTRSKTAFRQRGMYAASVRSLRSSTESTYRYIELRAIPASRATAPALRTPEPDSLRIRSAAAIRRALTASWCSRTVGASIFGTGPPSGGSTSVPVVSVTYRPVYHGGHAPAQGGESEVEAVRVPRHVPNGHRACRVGGRAAPRHVVFSRRPPSGPDSRAFGSPGVTHPPGSRAHTRA